MLVYADGQPLQNPITVERGIGRYVSELARAMEHNHPGAVSTWFLRRGHPIPVHTPELVRAGRYRNQGDPDTLPPDIWYQSSPFESLPDPVDTLWPAWARGRHTRLVSTLYDLIPLIYADEYLRDAVHRRSYFARLELLRHSSRILAISEATANDAIRLLGLPARKLEVVGTGVSDAFQPAASPADALAAACAEIPSLRPGYLMYTGGIDFRKNIDGLVRAYARLPQGLRRRHQLVIVCRMQPAEREHLESLAAYLGVADDTLFTGFVGNELLVTLYQAAHLFVFPSLYEGFGLPVVEATACGVPAIVGANSSLTEIVHDPRAHFDASSPRSIAAAMRRVLEDDELREALRRDATEHENTWAITAERTLEAFAAATAPAARVPALPRLAFVTPMPPTASGVADYSRAMLPHLAARARVDVFSEPDADRPAIPGVTWYSYRDFKSVERIDGVHDAHLVAMGNSEFHVDALAILQARGGIVMSHDVRYTGLFSVALRHRPRLVDTESRRILSDLYARRRAFVHASHTAIDPATYYTVNGLLCDPVITSSTVTTVHSRVAAMLARANLPVEQYQKVVVVPFGHRVRADEPPAVGVPPHDESPRDAVTSFGIVHWLKESVTVAHAFMELARRHPNRVFALVGHAVDTDTREQLEAAIAASGLGDRLVLTGRVSTEAYDAWLRRSAVAVQLRLHSNGESSAAVADCLGAGVPIITSNTGALAELKDVAVLLEPGISVPALVAAVDDLLAHEATRARLASRGLKHARANSFAAAANAVVDLALPATRGPGRGRPGTR